MNIKWTRRLVVLGAVCGLLAGCESVRDSVRERFSGMAPQVRVVRGQPKQVYAAARLAMTRLGYEVSRGGAAQGSLEGFTRIGGGDDFQSSRQRDMSVHLTPRDDGTVEVSVVIHEIVEDRFSRLSNPATTTPVRDPAVYEAYFDGLQQLLQGVGEK